MLIKKQAMCKLYLFDTDDKFFSAMDRLIFRESVVRLTKHYEDEACMLLMGGEL